MKILDVFEFNGQIRIVTDKGEYRVPMEPGATYLYNDVAVFKAVAGGYTAVFDDEGVYSFGEFVSLEDFNEEEFESIQTKEGA